MLVPLPPGEAVWIALTAPAGATITGVAVGGVNVRIVRVADLRPDLTLMAADALMSTDGPRPIDAAAIELADTRADLEKDHLTFLLVTGGEPSPDRLGVVLGTPALFEMVANLPAPAATSPDSAYGGWRLP